MELLADASLATALSAGSRGEPKGQGGTKVQGLQVAISSGCGEGEGGLSAAARVERERERFKEEKVKLSDAFGFVNDELQRGAKKQK